MAARRHAGHGSDTGSKEASQCMEWIQREQNGLEKADYGRSKRAVQDALSEHRHKVNVIKEFSGQVDKVTKKLKNEDEKEAVNIAYDSLKYLSEKKLSCLENVSQIASMEDLFGSLTADIADKATALVDEAAKDKPKVPEKDGEAIPHFAQGCILAVRNNWNWLSRLVRCTDVHLKHVAEYHEFFHDLSEYDNWLPSELKKVQLLLTPDGLKGNREDATRLLTELKAALTIFLTWQGKTDSVFDRAKKIVPIHYRSRKLDHHRPITSLCNYKTNDIDIMEGEELILLDNKMSQSWLVRSRHSVETYIPSIICLIPPPDPHAVNMALRLRLLLLGIWTGEVKRIGKTVIYFLLLVFREWNKEEEEVLKALPDDTKRELAKMCDFIESTLDRYWSGYPDFQLLQKRFRHLKSLLAQEGDPKYKNSEMGRALIVQIGVVEELVRRYKDLWSYWETYKILVEVCRHGELVLISQKWEDLKFIDTLELLKRWHIGFDSDSDSDSLYQKKRDQLDYLYGEGQIVEEVIEEENVGDVEALPNGSIEGEVYNVETSMETAEADHISSAEQEERKTFVITSVLDPKTGTEISLNEAVMKGIINQNNGTYVNRDTDTTLPIPVAMNAGWIKVEYTSTKKTAEKKRDIGIITIKTQRESRPYTVKAVKDVATDKMLNVDDAIANGLIDFNKNTYRNRVENCTITIADALDSGLLDVEIDDDTVVSEPTMESKTYAIYAVIDQKSQKRVAFGEAVRIGLIDPETGAYHHNVLREQIYVGDAIRQGFIKASVVSDPKTLDIAPENKTVIEKMQKRLGAMKAVDAFRRAGNHKKDSQ